MNLKKVRTQLNLTQRQMASKLSLNYNTYLSYEYGHRNPSRFTFEHIERVTRGLLDRPVISMNNVRQLTTQKEENNESSTNNRW